MANEGNLIPGDKRSPEEARNNGRKGGIASGKARRHQKDLREAVIAGLAGMIQSKTGESLTVAEAIARAQLSKALKGDAKAFQLVSEMIYPKKQELKMEGNVVTKLPDLNINFLADVKKDDGGSSD